MRTLPKLIETGPESSSHDRLLEAAKILFATRGYENTATSAIARVAGTSESQLMKHFGSKEGALEAIFDQGWARLLREIERIPASLAPEQRLAAILDVVMAGLDRDAQLRDLMLMEGRRIRTEGNMVLLTSGYIRFIELVDDTLEQMRRQGSLRRDVRLAVLRSALMGMLEGMMRDVVLARRGNYPADFSSKDIRETFLAALRAFGAPVANKRSGVATTRSLGSTPRKRARK